MSNEQNGDGPAVEVLANLLKWVVPEAVVMVTAEKLISHFGLLNSAVSASPEEIRGVVGADVGDRVVEAFDAIKRVMP